MHGRQRFKVSEVGLLARLVVWAWVAIMAGDLHRKR